MHKQQALLVVFLVTLQTIYGQVPFLGHCPEVSVMRNFQPERYLGRWYEARRYFAFFELGGKCVTADYSLKTENGNVRVVNRMISAITGAPSEIEGEATLIENSDEAKLTVVFPGTPEAPYWILDSDYETYSVVWSCTEFGLFSTMNAWLLTREQNPQPEIIERAYQVFQSQDINTNYLLKTDQINCPANN